MEPSPQPQLRDLIREAVSAARVADPLTMVLVGEPIEVPVARRDEELAALAAMGRIAGSLEALGPQSPAADEFDRVALLFGLRRATLASPDGPLGSRLMERHLLVRLALLAQGAPGAVESLLELVDAGPGILARSRSETVAGSAGTGRLALEAARRMPALLDACANAAGALPIAVDMRTRVEAALGPLLQAAAEDSGWLLKEFIPGAPAVTPQPLPDPLWAGLGFSLEELEAQAEGGLASAVAELNDADRAPQVPGGGEPASAPDVAAAWRQALHHAAQRLKISEPWPATIVTAPTWLRSLLPPLAVMVPGPGFGGPALILLGTRPREGLEEAVEDLLLRDYLAVAAARANFRSARALLPAPELAEGWRATSAPRAGATELAWRSALALAAIAMARGRTGIDEAAAMIAAESGIDPEQARLQAMQVAERPLAALTFLAGRRVLIDGAARHGDAAVAAWLAEGALPGAALRALAG